MVENWSISATSQNLETKLIPCEAGVVRFGRYPRLGHPRPAQVEITLGSRKPLRNPLSIVFRACDSS